MATQKSTQAARKTAAKKSSALKGIKPADLLQVLGNDDAELVSVPFLTSPRARAPEADPYLRPESVTAEVLEFGGVSLPPILTGYQPGQDLQGKAIDYRVQVIWANRSHIDSLLQAIGRERPELDKVIDIVRAFMGHMDSVRDHAKFGLHCVAGQIRAGELDKAAEALKTVTASLGRWNDEHRLALR